ncbi:MAG: metal-transporting ATPase, partial [Clostridia bacterium]|nr:metal-transporting ATPase [Clostridia bacterium]
EHPLAKAILARAAEEKQSLPETESFTALPGNGLTATAEGHSLLAGNLTFTEKRALIAPLWREKTSSLAEEGKTPLFFVRDGQFLGVIAVADTVKAESARAIEQLKNMGVRVVMLTGDNERTAKAIAGRVGVDEVIAGVLPGGKEEAVRALGTRGKVMMVGDGLNDAPALTRADIGVAIGAGTDVALDAADMVLMKSRLTDVPAAIRLSRATLRIIHQNLFWAFFYNLIGIPLAAGLFGLTLDTMFRAAEMSFSSFCVVSNALRLNWFRLFDAKRDKKRKQGEGNMTKILQVEGMMCTHCEARVQKALEALAGVKSARADHAAGTATVELTAPVADETLKAAVEAQEYTVTGIR